MNTDRSHSIHAIVDALKPFCEAHGLAPYVVDPTALKTQPDANCGDVTAIVAGDGATCPACHAPLDETGACSGPDDVCRYRREAP